MKGARVLSVQGRKTGEWHSTPVNALSTAGQRYLVAPRGETQWVRNIRVSREARLTLGRRTETVHVVEVPDREKAPIFRAYLNGRVVGRHPPPVAQRVQATVASVCQMAKMFPSVSVSCANHPIPGTGLFDATTLAPSRSARRTNSSTLATPM